MINRAELKEGAKQALHGKWGISIGIFLIYLLIVSIPQFIPIIGPIAIILCTPALILGIMKFFLKIIQLEDVFVADMFSGFSSFLKAFGLNFMVGLFTLLWALLLIIPGIIAAISYSMVYFILADNPEIGIMEAIRESKKMTNGYKMDIFVLGLSFIGWGLLCIITAGIGFIWLFPYMQATYANLYEKLKGDAGGNESNIEQEFAPID